MYTRSVILTVFIVAIFSASHAGAQQQGKHCYCKPVSTESYVVDRGCVPDEGTCHGLCATWGSANYGDFRDACANPFNFCNTQQAPPDGAFSAVKTVDQARDDFAPTDGSVCVTLPDGTTVSHSMCFVTDGQGRAQFCGYSVICDVVGHFMFTEGGRDQNKYCILGKNYHTKNKMYMGFAVW